MAAKLKAGEWLVELVNSPSELRELLQRLTDANWTIFEILTEGFAEGYCYTVVARWMGV